MPETKNGQQECMGFADSMQKGGGYESVSMNDSASQKTAKEYQRGSAAFDSKMTNKGFQDAAQAPYAKS